jgi:hypothetical protein
VSLRLKTRFSLDIKAFQGLEIEKNVTLSTVFRVSEAGIRFA